MEAVNQILGRVPFMIIALIYCAWMGYEHYDWLNSSKSELGLKRAKIVTMQGEVEALKKKVQSAEEFFQSLDTIRARVRQLTVQLEATKTTLSSDIDVANFVRMITLEAKKLSLSIKGIKPNSETKKEYFIETPFTVTMRGAYVQVLVFFDRIARLNQVIRISDFSMKPTGSNLTKYVELEGNVKLVAYKYLGTSADEIATKDTLKPGGVAVVPVNQKGKGRKK